ncbi:MAG: hypothetical protein ACFE7R_04860 [Candidatus Hodarchaeota archaeon]
MDTERLLEFLIEQVSSFEGFPWMSGYSDYGSFDPDGPPSGDISVKQVGKWLWVKAVISYYGSTTDQTTDRLSGDPYEAEVSYDWIGLADSAPSKVSKTDDLDKWAEISLKYVCENTDVGLWGTHEGSWVGNLEEDGTVTIYEAKGRYEDVTPESTAQSKTVKLKS